MNYSEIIIIKLLEYFLIPHQKATEWLAETILPLFCWNNNSPEELCLQRKSQETTIKHILLDWTSSREKSFGFKPCSVS